MLPQALSAEARALSATCSTDTDVNWRPTQSVAGTGTENENGKVAIPALSPSVLAFLTAHHEDAAALASKSVVSVPEVPDDLPLKHYFISSSHNTYLLSWQVLGRSSAAAYTHVLLSSAPARCVEVDVWWDGRPGQGIPIVTHGWTLSKSVPFVDVCAAIGEAVKIIRGEGDGMDWPVFVSLECHVPLAHQNELVQIMVDSWGEMLVQGEVEGLCGDQVTPRQLRGRIVLMVEYYPDEVTYEPNGIETDCRELDGESWVVLEKQSIECPCDAAEVDRALVNPKIADSLANLGFYARSMKPPNGWWHQVFPNPPYPPNITLNVNERRLPPLPLSLSVLQRHGTSYLRRVYPHGFRLTSSNLDPWIQWQSGTHMACLNWQKWDEAMWLNEAMFGGTSGWVLKPDPDASGEPEAERERRFTGRVVGLSALPHPEGGQHDFVGYCHVELLHSEGRRVWRSSAVRATRNTIPVVKARADDVDLVHLTWDEAFEWTFGAEALTFIQLKVVRRHTVGHDEVVAVFCARLAQLATGWCLIRLLDMHGKYVGATLLCEFTLARVEDS